MSELEKREEDVNTHDAKIMLKHAEISKREESLQNNEKVNNKQVEKMRITRLQLEAKRRDLERERNAFSKLVESKRLGDDLTTLLNDGDYGRAPSETQVEKMKDDLRLEIRLE